jgi:methyl-accepting chemotaxis protein
VNRVKLKLQTKVQLATALTLIVVLSISGFFVLKDSSHNMMTQETKKSDMMAQSIIKGMSTVMMSVNAPALSHNLIEDQKKVKGILRIQMIRRDGTPAFYDNGTIQEVNRWRHYQAYTQRTFITHPKHDTQKFAHDTRFKKVLDTGEAVSYKESIDGAPALTKLFPVPFENNCYLCHGYESHNKVMAVLRISTPLAEFNKAQHSLTVQVFLLYLAVIAILIVILSILVRVLTIKPIHQVVEVIGTTAEGDLTRTIEPRTQDEIGDLMVHFNAMVGKLRELIIRQIEEGKRAAEGARHMLNRLDGIRSRCDQEAEQVQTASAATEELSRSFNEVARNTRTVADLSSQTDREATKGLESIQRASSELSRISGIVSDASNSILELGKSSEQISQIVNIIDEIAEQTNLLALNAAIEAARAGEQGKGFAVVADEVRKLAERTTRSTREISDTIKAIQDLTEKSVKVMTKGSREMTELITVMTSASDLLTGIVASVKEVTVQVNQIALATTQQSQAVSQVASAVENASVGSQTIRQSAIDAAEAGSELEARMQDLEQFLRQFKTGQ